MIGAFGALTTYLLFFDGQTSVRILPIMIVGAIIASKSAPRWRWNVSRIVSAERATTRTADHRDRYLRLPAGVRPALLRAAGLDCGGVRRAIAVGVGYVGSVLTKADLNHQTTKWYDRAPLIGPHSAPSRCGSGSADRAGPECGPGRCVVVLGIGRVGTAVGWLAGLATRRRGTERGQAPATVEAAAAAVVFAELFWVFYKQRSSPASPGRAPSSASAPADRCGHRPRAGRRRGDHPWVGDLHRGGAGGVRVLLWVFIDLDLAGLVAQAVSQIPTPPAVDGYQRRPDHRGGLRPVRRAGGDRRDLAGLPEQQHRLPDGLPGRSGRRSPPRFSVSATSTAPSSVVSCWASSRCWPPSGYPRSVRWRVPGRRLGVRHPDPQAVQLQLPELRDRHELAGKHSGGMGRGCSAADEADRGLAGIADAVLVIVLLVLELRPLDPERSVDQPLSGRLADPRDHRPARAGPAARRAGATRRWGHGWTRPSPAGAGPRPDGVHGAGHRGDHGGVGRPDQRQPGCLRLPGRCRSDPGERADAPVAAASAT